MKRILLLLVFITLNTLNANNTDPFECAMSGISYFPVQKEIGLNSKFIIQGYSYSQKTIINFKDKQVYLESEEGEIIQLELDELLIGQFLLTQAVFKTSKTLSPNTKYYLRYVNSNNKLLKDLKRYNRSTKKNEPVHWVTGDKSNQTPLNPKLKIKFKKTNVIYYGCGPEANAIFTLSNNGGPEVWYKTELFDLSTKNTKIFYLHEWNKTLNVGHDMCAGAFNYNEKGKYKVRFTPMNSDGKSLKTTKWKTFYSPYKYSKDPMSEFLSGK